MKKLVSTMLIFLVFLSLPAHALAASTDKRDLIEFCELYMQRITLFQIDEDVDYGTRPGGFAPPAEVKDGMMFSCTAGSVVVDPRDYSIVKFDTTLSDFDASDIKNEQYTAQSIIAFSSLEYDSLDNTMTGLYNSAGLNVEGSDAVEKAMILWGSDDFNDAFNTALEETIKTEKEAFLYSGNYDYYLLYVNAGSLEQIWMIAEAK
jgi:hypothetical protein